ncbi:MAG: hypothetical protein QMD86_02860 [Patescibacteria group bacterium]|nr:hypothetical protein [Patescibacteria group bacterium]
MAKAAMEQEEDKLFSAAGDLRFPYKTWETPGDRVKGVYVGKFNSISNKYGYEQENYVLLLADGSKMMVGGRNRPKGGNVKIIFGVDKVPLGAVMGFIYTGDKDTGKGNACKLIEPKYLGEKDLDALKKFQEMYNLEKIKAASSEETAAGSAEEGAEEEPEL